MRKVLIIFLIFINGKSFSQDYTGMLNSRWEFSRAGSQEWFPANVPGSVHTDLLKNKLIPDPFFADNEKSLQWIDSCDWTYRSSFDVHFPLKDSFHIYFEGLDTYANVYINDSLIIQSNNMFLPGEAGITGTLINGKNIVTIRFRSALHETNRAAKAHLPLILPDNDRVYARKAQYQFGWDWGPKFISCGIWQPVSIYLNDEHDWYAIPTPNAYPVAKLIQKKDSIGESFYFEKDGKPVYIKGANWIPANIFPAAVTHNDYRKLLLRAKDAHMNMLRVWGGGIYEDDYFYDLCDSLGIMVWQDFMFAGGMYPADDAFLRNVKEEVKYQISRLRRHPCIILWCGNNEIDEAWHNWGWQNQFNIHGADSAKLWADYKKLFVDSLAAWVKEFDGERAYISSSPRHGWGHKESFTEGDSHYWGLWWGLEPWETFETHTGRFVSEYGMQSMPNFNTVTTYVPPNDLRYSSPAVQWHQKANEGFKKLNFYLDKYFIASAKLKDLPLEIYTYLTQCLQYYILKNSIATHRSKAPRNMGTLLWQLNDCWPATSWSITDFSRAPKAAWYAVKEAYRDDVIATRDNIYPKNLRLEKANYTLSRTGDLGFYITANTELKYVFLRVKNRDCEFAENYFDMKKGEKKYIGFADKTLVAYADFEALKIITLNDVLRK